VRFAILLLCVNMLQKFSDLFCLFAYIFTFAFVKAFRFVSVKSSTKLCKSGASLIGTLSKKRHAEKLHISQFEVSVS